MMRQWELDQNPYLRAILDVRLRNAGDFSPERSGIQGAAYDKAVLDCYWAVAAALEAQVDRSPEGQDGETRLDRNDESAVAESDAPKGA
jgi:hypothetical protein